MRSEKLFVILCNPFQHFPLLRQLLISKSELMSQQIIQARKKKKMKKRKREFKTALERGILKPPEWTSNDALRQGIWVNVTTCHSQALYSCHCLFDARKTSCKKSTLKSVMKSQIFFGAFQYEGDPLVCACVRVCARADWVITDPQWETVCGSVDGVTSLKEVG